MNKLVLLLSVASLVACSSTDTGIKFSNKSPRGITVSNVYKEYRSKAYQSAERHCAKYSKVPRKLKTIQETDKYTVERVTIKFECIKPSR
jgi:uncharacterized lipoprotein YehR (DUF1307 family)